MNAYVTTADGVRVIEGAGWLEVAEDGVVLVRGSDREHRPIAAVRLGGRCWVAIGSRPPARLERAVIEEARQTAAAVGAGGWPPEPPPDVDSEP